MKISNYITSEQACKSETAIRKGIDNTPNEDQLKAMKLLCEKVYDPICKTLKISIPATSFFRSEKLNKTIGGSSTSQHCKGEAIDLDCDGLVNYTNKQLFDFIKAEDTGIEFDQLIWEYGDDKNPAWVHVSYSAMKNRGQILKAIKVNGKTKYVNHG